MLLPDTGYVISTAYKCGSADWASQLIMLDRNGDSVGIYDNAYANGYMRPTNDGNLLFLGGTSAALTYDTMRISKTTYAGDTLWNTELHFPICANQVYDAVATSDGGYAITGIYSTDTCSNAASFNSFVVKLDANGDELWRKTFGGPEDDQLFYIYEQSNGDLIAGGWSKSTANGDADVWLLQLNAAGDSLASLYYGVPNVDELAYGFTTTYNNNYVVQFYSDSIYALKLSANGNLVWQQSLGIPSGGRYFQVKETSDLQYVFLSCRNSPFGCESHLTKIDRDGNLKWDKTWGGLMREVVEDSAGSFLLAGYSTAFPNPSRLHVVRFDTIVDDIDTTAINELPYPMQVQMYPNPANDRLFINSITNSLTEVQVIDMQGQLMLAKRYINDRSVELDISSLAKAVYLVKVMDRENRSSYHKLLVH